MARTSPVVVLLLSASLLASCASTRPVEPGQPGATKSSASSASSASSPATPSSAGASALPANSPLTSCVDPKPTRPRPVDTSIAADFAGDRVQAPLSLDDGAFRATPAPPNLVPRISAALAFCNLLAAATATNFTVIGAATEHGLSFGLGVVTVAQALLSTRPRMYMVGDEQETITLAAYQDRLAWIALIKPDIIANCPMMSSAPVRATSAPALAGYQILAIDANTGAAGIVYSAEASSLCGEAGIRPPSVAPAVEFVSVPWTLVKRGPGPQAAAITYEPRPCDDRHLPTFDATGEPVVTADRDRPGLVEVELERTLTSCGPAVSAPLLLRSATLASDLPPALVHAPVGAIDVSG
jgi:hypothetical protein